MNPLCEMNEKCTCEKYDRNENKEKDAKRPQDAKRMMKKCRMQKMTEKTLIEMRFLRLLSRIQLLECRLDRVAGKIC